MWQGLPTRILFWIILPLAIILIGLAYVGVNSHQASMRAMVAERDGELARVEAVRLSELLADRKQELADLDAAHPNTWDTNPFDGGVALIGPVRNILASVPGDVTWKSRLDRIPQSAPFSNPFIENGHWYVIVAQPKGENIAAGAFRLPELGGLAEHGNSYLVDASGIVIADSQPSQLGTDLSRHEGIAQVIRGQSGSTFHYSAQGEELVVGYAPVAAANWGLLIDEPWADVIAPMFQYSVLLPVILVLVAVLALGVIYFGVGNIVRPLHALAQVANRIAFGDYEAAARPVGGIREVEELRETLDGMARKVRAGQEAMQRYIGAITRGQEDERKRLARELHDDTIQSLIALQQRVEMTQKVLARDPVSAAAKLGELRNLVGESLTSVRRFVRDLRPTYLDELGLIPALETLANESGAEFVVEGDERRVDAEREIVLFRIVQEALRNVNKHARAKRICVRLKFGADEITTTVQDDGVGFDAPKDSTPYSLAGHFGLAGMQERAQLFGGNVYIKSQRGQGTTVIAYLPSGQE